MYKFDVFLVFWIRRENENLVIGVKKIFFILVIEVIFLWVLFVFEFV